MDEALKRIEENQKLMLVYLEILVMKKKGRLPKKALDDLDASSPEKRALVLIGQGHPGLSKEIVSTRHLSRLLGDSCPKSLGLAHLMATLGYSKVDESLKWRGELLRVWVSEQKEHHAKAELRKMLDRTLVEEILK